MGDCEYLRVGDKVFYRKRLATITEIRPDGVMVGLGTHHKFIFCSDLFERRFRTVIQWTTPQGDVFYEYPTKTQDVDREVNLLKQLNFKVIVFREEVLED